MSHNPDLWGVTIFGFKIKLQRTSIGEQGEQRSDLLNRPSQAWLNLFGAKSKSGARVTEKTALGLPAVYAAVRVLSESIASLPWRVIERNGDDRRSRTDHGVYWLLSREPSPFYSAYTFWASIMTNLLLHGNAYVMIHRDAGGRPDELEILPQGKCYPFIENGELFYRVSGFGQPFYPDQILHFKGMSSDGLVGMSVLSTAREMLGQGIALQDFGSTVFENGSFPSGILTTDQSVKSTDRESIETGWRNRTKGVENGGATPVLSHGFKYQPIALSPADAKFVETTKLTLQAVASIFRVPPHMLQNLDRATFNNIETMSLEFVKYSLLPWVRMIELEVERKLFTMSERGRLSAKLNLEGLQRGDFKTRTEGYKTLWMVGAMSANEIRSKEDMNPIPNGDQYMVPVNYTLDETPTKAKNDATT